MIALKVNRQCSKFLLRVPWPISLNFFPKKSKELILSDSLSSAISSGLFFGHFLRSPAGANISPNNNSQGRGRVEELYFRLLFIPGDFFPSYFQQVSGGHALPSRVAFDAIFLNKRTDQSAVTQSDRTRSFWSIASFN